MFTQRHSALHRPRLAGFGGDFRCRACGILLGTLDGTGLSIRRGQLQATVDGRFRASIVCYRPSCRALNILRVTTPAPGPPAG